MNEIKIPIFDLDDTLFCEHDYVRSGFKAVAQFIANETSVINVEQIYVDFIDVWRKKGRGRIFDIVCEKYNIKIDITNLVKVYRNHVPKIYLYKDAKEILSYLKFKKIPIGIITDGDSAMQWRKIESLQLKDLINVIIVTDDVGKEYCKPSPVPYLHAAKLLRVPIERCIYIGDNPHKDFITAKKLGMQTIRIVRPTGDHMKTSLSDTYEADKTIHSLYELQKVWC